MIKSDGSLQVPLDIRNVSRVDDAGSEQLECTVTAAFLIDLYDSGLLALTGNIRPGHQQERLAGKLKTKINKWTGELLANNAIIGNISIRLDPTKSQYDIWTDEETGQEVLTVTDGQFDCGVDSLSRIKSILAARDNPLGSFRLDTRFQVRVWLLDDENAKKVATIYNTRGDKVNDSTAKFAYTETKEQELARRLVNGSPHLGQENVEVLANAVSASSSKIAAFNTFSKALETYWKAGPASEADVSAQSAWLISAWDSLVAVRPEYGRLSTSARQAQRSASVATTGVVIYGLLGALSVMYEEGVDPSAAFAALKGEAGDDFLSWDNPAWTAVGVVTPNATGGRTTRNSFQARAAARDMFLKEFGISG